MEYSNLQNLKKLSALVAEDDAGVRSSLCLLLENFFGSVSSCENGREALESYRKELPDIIFTDISMPEMDGIDLIKKIRSGDKNTMIVIISALSEKEHLLEAVRLYLDDYLIKPLKYDSFIKLMQKISSKVGDDRVILKEGTLFEPLANRLQYGEKTYSLSPKEAKLLKLLWRNKNSVVSYTQIEQSVWYEEGMSQDAIRTLVKSLRKKGFEESIKNISKEGYLLSL